MICGKRHSFADVGGRKTFGQRGRRRLRGLLGSRAKNRLAELIDKLVFRGSLSSGAIEELMFFQQLRQQRARFIGAATLRPGFGFDTITN